MFVHGLPRMTGGAAHTETIHFINQRHSKDYVLAQWLRAEADELRSMALRKVVRFDISEPAALP